MISLKNQLKSDLTTLFSSRTDDYKDTIVKKEYEDLPKGHYPRVIISEITNNSMLNRETSEGEQTTQLGYQFSVYSRDMTDYGAADSVDFMIKLIDDFIRQNYKMSRVTITGVQPYITDSTVKTNISRYTCVYDNETQLIYTN
jgi:L-cysteine desulfidase